MTDLQALFELLDKKYRVVEIHFSFEKNRNPEVIVDLKLERNGEKAVLSSSQGEFISYVGHLHSIPHAADDGSDFVYIDNPGRYFDLQEKIVNLLTGKDQEIVICERNLEENFQKYMSRVTTFQRTWLLSEKNVPFQTYKLCQIFYDVGILLIKGSKEEFKLVAKESIGPDELRALLKESLESDIAVCFSAFIVGPQAFSSKKRQSEAIIGLLTYDLKNRQTLQFNLNSLSQFQTKLDGVGKYGLWECLFNLHERTRSDNSLRSFLPLPVGAGDSTPLPWFCFAFTGGVSQEIVFDNIRWSLPLFLTFGTPLLLMRKPSYGFDSRKQAAFIMLGFKDDHGKQSYHQVRFDISKGEPRLHLDYQIYGEGKAPMKIVSHSVIDYRDIWNFSENLAISFLLASTYDVNFDTVVVPQKLSGLNEAFRSDPLTVYPLFVRSMASGPFRRVRTDVGLQETLNAVARGEIRKDGAEMAELESMHLLKGGRLTILGHIVYRRLLQGNQA